MAKTNNGKNAEKAVHDTLKDLARNTAHFDFQRLYDATSARGIMAAQVGDFLFFMPNAHGVLEVKSTQHDYRLSIGAFSELQRAKLYKRHCAGSHVYVLAHHWKINKWRVVPFENCYQAFNQEGKASVDLRDYPTYDTADHAIATILENIINET